jgi:hypothetical protein
MVMMMSTKRNPLVDPNSPQLAPASLQFRLISHSNDQGNSETHPRLRLLIGIESAGLDKEATRLAETKWEPPNAKSSSLLLPL